MQNIVGASKSSSGSAVQDSDILIVIPNPHVLDCAKAPPAPSRLFSATKRAVDILVATTLILIFSPVMALTAFLIWLDDHGAVLYHQIKIGRNGKEFKLHMFRTTHLTGAKVADALRDKHKANGGQLQVIEEAGVNPVTWWMRKYRIDELPQLFCVLFGQMSIIGPRPNSPLEAGISEPEQRLLQFSKPGLVCLREVGSRKGLTQEERRALDIDYVMNRSAWTETKIFFGSLPTLLFYKRSN